MRAVEEILKEVQTECTKDNCQSWNSIAILAMERAIKESKEDIITELENLSNSYVIINNKYVIHKSDFDNYIQQLEYDK